MYTLKLDEFHVLSPSPEISETQILKRKRKGWRPNNRRTSHNPQRKQAEEPSETGPCELKPDQSVLLQHLLTEEKAHTARLAQQLKEQSVFISSLISQKSQKSDESSEGTSMGRVNRLQGRVMEALQVITEKAVTKTAMQTAEVDRICSSRIADLQREFEEEKKLLQTQLDFKEREIDAVKDMLEKCKSELESTEREWRQTLKALNEAKTDSQNLEMTRQILHRQIIELKRDNKKLSEDHSHMTQRMNSPISPRPTRFLSTPSRAMRTSDLPCDSSQSHFQRVLSRLRHMLELEKRNVRTMRSALAAELQTKRDVESIVKDAMGSLKAIIKDEKSRDCAQLSIGRPPLLEVLLTHKRTLELIHEKAFPQGQSSLSFRPSSQSPLPLDASLE